jgi:ABC-type Na+ efflux pump permease subunit
MSQEEQKDPEKVTFLSSMLSACFAAFGVQSKKNLERDFKHKKPSIFIISGILFVILFISVVYTVVQVVLSSAGVQ